MHATIIFNPTAGQTESPEQQMQAAADVWRERGWEVDLQPTSGPDDATRLARMAVEQQHEVVLAAGGDGTINEVINGMVGNGVVGSLTALGALPLGTTNVWIRELKLPLQPQAAAIALLDAQTRTIDLGCANGRYFLLMTGIGLDAAVTAQVQFTEKRRLGMLAFVLRGFRLALQFRGARLLLQLDGKTVKRRVLMVVIGNSQLYGGVVRITHRAQIDDGMLDVCVIKGDNVISALYHALSILAQRYVHLPNPDIEYYRARTIKVTAHPALPMQIDGENFGQTPGTFEVVPGALRTLMPANLPNDLVRATIEPVSDRVDSL
mgnify:CR=1 FL=1